MYYTMNVSLACVVVCLRLVLCVGKDQNLTTAINIYSKSNIAGNGIAVSECIAENTHYYIITNQSVKIKLHHNVLHYNQIECDTPPLKITFVNKTIGFPNLIQYENPSVGPEELFEHCNINLNYNTIGYVYPSGCSIYKIYVTDTNNDNGKFANDESMINTYLTVDPEKTNTMAYIVYHKNSQLNLSCIELDPDDYTQVLVIEGIKYRTEMLKREEYLNGLYLYNMDESLNDLQLMLFVTDKRTNSTMTAGVTLRYEKEIADSRTITWIVVTTVLVLALTVGAAIVAPRLYSKFKGKHKRVISSTARYNGRLSTPIENDYDFIYDNVYEDRRRLEQAARGAQERREAEGHKAPTPPPVETIPVKKVPDTCVTNVRRYSMLTPASDMYLLQIDSEGYQIPEIVQMRGIQLDQDELRK